MLVLIPFVGKLDEIGEMRKNIGRIEREDEDEEGILLGLVVRDYKAGYW